MLTFPRLISITLLLLLVVVGGCYPPAADSPLAGGDLPQKIVVGLGYIPSVQFAPFYLAQEKGYFAEQGLDVQFQHGIETDFLKLVAVDQIPFVVASGEQVILARSQGLPVTYVAAWYHKFPVVVFAPQERSLGTPSALAGSRVGIPGLFGASLVAWKALVYATGLDESQVTLETIGFTQAAAVSEGRVDAAIDYVVNGPVQLRAAGRAVDVIEVSNYIDLPSNGLVTNESTVQQAPELVQKMVTAMLKGIRDTLADPDEAFAASLAAVPEAGGDNTAINRAIFDASLDLWRVPLPNLGYSDPDAWTQASAFMAEMGLIAEPVSPEGLYTNQFVETVELD